MDEVVAVDPIVGRFEKVLRVYWDGIPVPPFVAGGVNVPRRTFIFRLLGYSPDYHGEVKVVDLTNTLAASTYFLPLAEGWQVSASMSTRIGSHYSPLAGLFRFTDPKVKTQQTAAPSKAGNEQIRIPADQREDVDSSDADSSPEYRQYVRMQVLTSLYESLVKEFTRLDQDSLRRIVILASRGLRQSSKQWVVREMSVVTDEYTTWQSQAIFFYMCVHPVFRKIVAPLQVMNKPAPRPFSTITLSALERQISRDGFRTAKRSLQATLFWNKKSRGFLEALRICWVRNFKRLALFDLSTEGPMTRTGAFLDQITNSMRAAFAKIRIEYYSNLEDFFFSYIVSANDIVVMNVDQIRESRFHRIFLAARVFQANMLRELLFENLVRLLEFFDCQGRGGRRLMARAALKIPLLQLELVVGDKYEPRSPAFAHFRFGLLDLFDELLTNVNDFPIPECALLRTLDFGDATIRVAEPMELAYYRASIMEILDDVASTIDDVSERFLRFADLPSRNAQMVRTNNFVQLQAHASALRNALCGVKGAAPAVVYSGRFAIICTAVMQEYIANWAKCQERFFKEYHAFVAEIIKKADQKCSIAMHAIDHPPRTVNQLRDYLIAVEAAKALAEGITVMECDEVVEKFKWMEEVQIPADATVYSAALEFMTWPARLRANAARSVFMREQCRPVLLAELHRLHIETRENIRTLATGVTELYNMFNLEICDIAAQTCSELRELVNHVNLTVALIRSQEAALERAATDHFDDLPPMLTYFETIEQYWGTVHKATALRELYKAPVTSLNADKAIDDVREWRRLIRAATRSLRAFAPLRLLGRQQDAELAQFESREHLLRLLTTPGLRKSHWRDITRLVAAELADDAAPAGDTTVSLERLLRAGIDRHMADLERIAQQARTDYEAEARLEEMRSTAKRTYFQVATVPGEVVPRMVVSAECRHKVQSLVEGFIRESRALRRNMGLSTLVGKAVDEWESSSERTRDMFLRWEKIDKQWGNFYAFHRALDRNRREHRSSAEEWGAAAAAAAAAAATDSLGGDAGVMLDKLKRAAEAFHTVVTTISKPQFSLYMAIVQESINEHLSVARLAMEDVTSTLADTFERMRVGFPRFNFVSNHQLTGFLTAYNTRGFFSLLPAMYSRVSSVTIEENAITAFSTADGGSIPVAPSAAPGGRLALTDEPVDEWMRSFDRCLTASFFAAAYACASAYGKGNLEAWLGGWCTQLIVLALRVAHTKGMRDAVDFAGPAGLCAYRAKIGCIVDELTRLAVSGAGGADSYNINSSSSTNHGNTNSRAPRARLASALVYMHYAAAEADLALSNGVASAAELDATAMAQTFMTDTTIVVRLMGMDFAYGFEFLGDCQLPPMFSALLEKVATVLTLSGGVVATPILYGGAEKDVVLELVGQLLGSFVLRVQCCEVTAPGVLRPYLRGAIELGALLCGQEIGRLPPPLRPIMSTCLAQVQDALSQHQPRQRSGPTLMMPLGPSSGLVTVTVHPRFVGVVTTEDLPGLPRDILMDHRAIHFDRLGSAAVVRCHLTAVGLGDEPGGGGGGACSAGFGAMYEQFREADPLTFTDTALLALLRRATIDAPPEPPMAADDVASCLLGCFLDVFASRLREDGRLRRLLAWNIEYSLSAFAACLAGDHEATMAQLEVPVEQLRAEELFAQFDGMMAVCSNAVIVGPAFSGKGRMWRRWIGAGRYTVLSPSLMTSEDFYGTDSHPGFLASLGEAVPQIAELQTVVVEDADLAHHSLWAAWPRFSRVPGSDQCFTAGPLLRMIISAHSVGGATPRLAVDFGIFYVPAPQDWRRFLRSCVRSATSGGGGGGGWGSAAVPVPAPANNASGSRVGSSVPSRSSSQAHEPSPLLTDMASHVMEALLPEIFAAVYPGVPLAALAAAGGKPTQPQQDGDGDGDGDNGRQELTEAEASRLFALCQRSASLFRHWFRHATTQYGTLLGRVVSPDALVEDRTFAAQCAVFAVSWAAGLALPDGRQQRLTQALRRVERSVQGMVEANFAISEAIFPPLYAGGDHDDNSNDPHGGILQCVVTRGGWQTFSEAAGFGLSPLWAHRTLISAQNRAWSQRFPLPSRVPVLTAVEFLLNCGQSVILDGEQGSGKSTLLQTVARNDRWVSQLVSTNRSLNATAVQREMATGLTRRSDGRFGPPLGRRLVVCIDDVHLSEPVAPGLPIAGRLMDFCTKYGCISTPESGLVPIADTVFFGTTMDSDHSAVVLRACVPVRLPSYCGGELVEGLSRLFEAVCARKRVDGFWRECASFLTIAHAAFVRLLPSTPDQFLLGGSFPGTSVLPPRNHPLVAEMAPVLPWRFADALRAAEFTRQQLMSSSPDMLVATNLFAAVKTLYASFMTSLGVVTEVTVFKTRLADAAQKTLGACVPDVNFASILADERRAESGGDRQRRMYRYRSGSPRRVTETAVTSPVAGPPTPSRPRRHLAKHEDEEADTSPATAAPAAPSPVSEAERDRVADWIAEFEITIGDASEEELETKYSYKPSTRASKKSFSKGDDASDASSPAAAVVTSGAGMRSKLITYTGSGGCAQMGGYPRGSTSMPNSAPGLGDTVPVSRRSSAFANRGSGGELDMSTSLLRTGSRRPSLRAGPATAPVPVPPSKEHGQHALSRTYQTTWLTALLISLYRTVHQHDSHAALVGVGSFGRHRLLRILCSATQVAFALFSEDRPGGYSFETAWTELRAVVVFAYSSNTRTIVFLPYEVLQVPGVIRQVDIIMLSGEIGELFSTEERAALGRDYSITHRGAHPLSPADYIAVRRRVRRNIRFILHVPTAARLAELCAGYPSLTRLMPIPLHSPARDAALLREIAVGILAEERITVAPLRCCESFLGEPVHTADCTPTAHAPRLLHDDERLAETIALVFEAVGGARVEQLMELTRIVRHLRDTRLDIVVRGAENAAVVQGRADEATEEITRDDTRAKTQTATLAATRLAITHLRSRLTFEEERHAELAAGLDAAQARLAADEQALRDGEAAMQDSVLKVAKTLATAATRLRKVRSAHVRALSVMRLPDKGVLLVRAVYRLLGEELPNYGGVNPNILWTRAVRDFCAAGFPAKMTARRPEEEPEPESLLAMEEDLSGVRYGNASPYAQLMADFFLAFAASIRVGLRVSSEDEPRLERRRKAVAAQTTRVKAAVAATAAASDATVATVGLIAAEEAACASLEGSLKELADRGRHLSRYVGLADIFSGFVKKEYVSATLRAAECAEGDIVLVAAYFSTLAARPDAEAAYEQARELLAHAGGDSAGSGLRSSPTVEDACKALFLPGAERALAPFIPDELPPRHRAALYGLAARISSRCQFIGGVCRSFELRLREFLALGCVGGCLVLSGNDPALKERLVRAMRDGAGVLLRDADSVVVCEIARDLLPALEQLQTHHTMVLRDLGRGDSSKNRNKDDNSDDDNDTFDKVRRPRVVGVSLVKTVKNTRPASSKSKAAANITCHVFGRDIEVNLGFLLVGTSTGLLGTTDTNGKEGLTTAAVTATTDTSNADSTDASAAATSSTLACASVVNLFAPVPQEQRFRGLLLAGSAPKHSTDELLDRFRRLERTTYDFLVAFFAAHSLASALLGGDIAAVVRVSGGGDDDLRAKSGDKTRRLLDRIEAVLAEVNNADGQLAHSAVQMQTLSRQCREAWAPVERCLAASADLLGFIEAGKLGRPWDDVLLDGYVAGMTTLSPELAARLAPQHYAELAPPGRFFYATVNYLDAVVRSLACGWPAPLRGTFSLYLLSGIAALTGSEDSVIASQRGLLFPDEVELLTPAQFDVLRRFLSGQGPSSPAAAIASVEHALALRHWLLAQYRAADDALLSDLARELRRASSGGGGGNNHSNDNDGDEYGDDCDDDMLVAFAVVGRHGDSSSSRGARSSGGDDEQAFFSSSGTHVAHFFRCLAALDLDQCEAAALHLCGTFFAQVKDANVMAKKASGDPAGDEVDGDEHAREEGDDGGGSRSSHSCGGSSGRSDANIPTTARTSLAASTGGGGGGGAASLASRLPPSHSYPNHHHHHRGSDTPLIEEVHSTAALLARATGSGIPLCLPTGAPTAAIKVLRQIAQRAKLEFHWHEVRADGSSSNSGGSSGSADLVLQVVHQCFHRRVLRRAGHMVVACVDPPGSGVASPRLAEEVHRLLAAYHGYRLTLAGRGSTDTFPVCLALVCSHEAHDALWPPVATGGCGGGVAGSAGESSCYAARRPASSCLYLNCDLYTPRRHLVSILRHGTIGSTVSAIATASRKSAASSLPHSSGGGGRVRLFNDLDDDDSYGGAGEHSSAAAVAGAEALTPLESAATLIAKEMAVVHVGVAALQSYLLSSGSRFPRDRSSGGEAGLTQCDDDSTLTALLRLLHSWVQRQLWAVDARAGDGGGGGADALSAYLARLPAGVIHAAMADMFDTRDRLPRPSVAAVAAGALATVKATPAALRGGGGKGFGSRAPSQLPGAAAPPSAAEPATPAAAPASLGLQAYLYYRSQCPAWRLYADPAEMGVQSVAELVASAQAANSKSGGGLLASFSSLAAPAAPVVAVSTTTLASLRRNFPPVGIPAASDTAPPQQRPRKDRRGGGGPVSPAAQQRAAALLHLRHVAFAVFQKLVAEVYDGDGGLGCGACGGSEYRLAVQRMVATIVICPRNTTAAATVAEEGEVVVVGDHSDHTAAGTVGESAAAHSPIGVHSRQHHNHFGADDDPITGALVTASGAVSCNMTGLEPFCPLVLDGTGSIADFAADVRGSGSDLTELLGDCIAYRAVKEGVRARLMALLRRTAVVPGAAAADAMVSSPSPLPPPPAADVVPLFDMEVLDMASEAAARRLSVDSQDATSQEDSSLWRSPFADYAAAAGGSDHDERTGAKENMRPDAGATAAVLAGRCKGNPTATLLWQLEHKSLRGLYDDGGGAGAVLPPASRRRLILSTARTLLTPLTAPHAAASAADAAQCQQQQLRTHPLMLWPPSLSHPAWSIAALSCALEAHLARAFTAATGWNSSSSDDDDGFSCDTPILTASPAHMRREQRRMESGVPLPLLVVARRRGLLSPTDVILSRARLSPLLQQEVERLLLMLDGGGSGGGGAEGSSAAPALATGSGAAADESRGDDEEGLVVALRLARAFPETHSVRFYEQEPPSAVTTGGGGSASASVVLTTLRLPLPPATAMPATAFYWRTAAQVNQGALSEAVSRLPPSAAATGGGGLNGWVTRVAHAPADRDHVRNNDNGDSVSPHLVALTAQPTACPPADSDSPVASPPGQQHPTVAWSASGSPWVLSPASPLTLAPPFPLGPTFVTATGNSGELGGWGRVGRAEGEGSPAHARSPRLMPPAQGRALRRNYALSQAPITLVMRGGEAAAAATSPTFPTSTSTSTAAITIERTLCVIGECRAAGGGVSADGALREFEAVAAAFPHPGALGHYIVFD